MSLDAWKLHFMAKFRHHQLGEKDVAGYQRDQEIMRKVLEATEWADLEEVNLPTSWAAAAKAQTGINGAPLPNITSPKRRV